MKNKNNAPGTELVGQRYATEKQLVLYVPAFSLPWLRAARIRGGGPPFIKFSRRVVYDLSAVDAWLSERTRSNTVTP